MSAFVVDASALFEIVVGRTPAVELRRHVLTGSGCAPELIDLEALNTLRRLHRSGDLSAETADRAAIRIASAPIARLPHRPLLGRVWALRESVAAYDAAYIALAETLDVPLFTCDARLGRAHGHDAEVLVYPRS